MKTKPILKLLMVMLLAVPAASVHAQQAGSDNARIDGDAGIIRTGVIDALLQDSGFIVIDGERVPFRESEVTITYKQERIDSTALSEGMRIRYRTRLDGSLEVITVNGTYEQLEQKDQH